MAGNLGSVSGSLNIDAAQAVAQVESLIQALQNLQQIAEKQIELQGIKDEAARAKADADALARSYQQAGTIALGAFVGLGAVIGGSVMSAGNLQQAIQNVSAALGGLPTDQVEALTASMQEIGTASQYSAAEVAGVAEALAKAGYGVEEITGGMTEAVVNLAQATGDGLQPAITGVVQAMSTWDASVVDASIALTDAGRAADVLTVAANESTASVTDIIAGMRNLGPVAAMMGISFEEAAAGVALFTNYGLKGADAGISLARGLQNLARPTEEIQRNLAKLGLSLESLGIQAYDLEGNFVGLPELFRQLQSGMAGLDDQTKLAALSFIFGAEAMDVMGLAIQSGADPLEQLIAAMGESGIAAEQAAMRTDTFEGALQRMAESVSTLGGTLAGPLLGPLQAAADGIANLASYINGLPGPVQNVIAGLTVALTALTGLSAALLLGSAAWLKYSSAAQLSATTLLRVAAAARTASLAMLTNPITAVVAGLTALVAVGGYMAKSWMDQRQQAQNYKATLEQLAATIEDTRRAGNTELADRGQELMDRLDMIHEVNEAMDSSSVYYREMDLGASVQDALAIRQAFEDTGNYTDQLQAKLQDALSDSRIDAGAWMDWVTGLLDEVSRTATFADDIEAWKEILDRPLSDFPASLDDTNTKLQENAKSAEEAAASYEKLQDVFGDMRFDMDDLRIEGMDQQAADIEELAAQIESAFTTMRTVQTEAGHWVGYPGTEELIRDTDLSEEALESLGDSWERIQDKMASGDFDNARIMADVLGILNDTELNTDQKVEALDELAASMSEYALVSNKVAQDTAKEWLSNGDNILEWWLEFQRAIPGGGAMLEGFNSTGESTNRVMDSMMRGLQGIAESQAPLTFEQMVDAAVRLNQASDGLDSVLATFGRIDELGQRSSKSGGIATALVGEPGEWAAIDDLLRDRIIGIETYNSAVQAGYRIQESDARVQQYLNKVRADQLPLLAAQQEAYERNIQNIAGMSAEEQQYTLALQDTAVQQQVAAQYALAYSAAVGEIPEEVASSMIINAAEADPVLASILEQMGLISVGADGKITVNFPEAEQVTDAINNLTDAVLALAEAMGYDIPDPRLPDVGEIDKRTEAYRRLADAVIKATGVPAPGSTPPGYMGPTEEPSQSTLPAVDDETEGVKRTVQAWRDYYDARVKATQAPSLPPGTMGPTEDYTPAPVQTPRSGLKKPLQTKPAGKPADWENPPGKVTQLPTVGGGGEEQFRGYISGLLESQRATGQWQQTVQQITSRIPQSFQTMSTGAIGGLKPITTTFQTAPATWQAPVISALGGINMGFSSNLAGLQGITQTGFGGAKTAALGETGAMSSGVVGATGGMAGGVLGAVSGMAGGVIGQASTMNSGTVGQSTAMAGGATAAALLMGLGLMAGAVFGTVAVRGQAAQWPGIVRATGGPMAAAGQYAGQMAGAGVAAGLLSTLGQVRSAASAIVAEVNRAMLAAGQIKSPSRLTMYIGEMLGLGLVPGMDAATPMVTGAARALMQDTISALRPSAFEGYGVGSVSGYMPSGMGGGTYITVAPVLQMNGPVYGMDDFEARVNDSVMRGVLPVLTSAAVAKRRGKGATV